MKFMKNEDDTDTKRLGIISENLIGHFRDLTWTSVMILYAYLNDEFILLVIHGKQGYGKSTLASIVTMQVYGVKKVLDEYFDKHQELFKDKTKKQQRRIKKKIFEQFIEENKEFIYDIDKAKKNIVFKPEQFLLLLAQTPRKQPTAVIDDAGMWLNALDYHNRFVKAVGKFFEVARTKFGALIFTCSDLKQVFTKLRNMPHVYTIRIIKAKSTHGAGHNPDERIGIIHEGWETEDLKRSGRTMLLFDGFVAEMPESFYSWYQPLREKLTNEGIKEMVDEFNKMVQTIPKK